MLYTKLSVDDFIKNLRKKNFKLVEIYNVYRSLENSDKNNLRLLETITTSLSNSAFPYSAEEVKESLKVLKDENYLKNLEEFFVANTVKNKADHKKSEAKKTTNKKPDWQTAI